jgi:hypothetical protein
MSGATTTFEAGDRVEWRSAGGTSRGEVERKLTEPMESKGHHAAASKDEPQHLVVSDATGAEAAPKPEAPRKL